MSEGDDKFRQELFGSAFEVQRKRALGQVSLLRVFAMGAFLLFAIIALQCGYADWGRSVPVLAVYTVAAGLLVAAQGRVSLSSLVYSAAAVADVLVIFEVQRRALLRTLHPAGVAAWTLAPFTMLVLIGALWLRPMQISLVALAAAVCECVLQQEAGEDPSRIASSVVLLAFAGIAAGLVGRQVKDLVDSVGDGLNQWRNRYLLLLDRNHAGVYRGVIGQGITECNATFARMLGYDSPGELIGLRRSSVYSETDRQEMLSLLRREKRTSGRELQLRRKDGATVWVLENTTLLDGDVVEGVVLDISDRKALQERLLISDRMYALGSLASAVAHEINNPLGYILGNVEHALESLPAGDDLREALIDAREGALRVRRIVSDMQTLAREDSVQPVPVDLLRVVEAAVGVADRELRKRARVVLDLGAVPRVTGSQGRLGQVVLNLLLNAARAIPPGDTEGNQIRVSSSTAADGSAVLEVSDTGPPLAPEVATQVFSTRAASAGTGLSLFVCHSIVTAFGGRISVRSEPGEGTSFRVQLPAAK